MLDGAYKKLTSVVDYRILAAITPVLAVLMVFVIAFNGLEYGIDFMGGMWIDILTEKDLSQVSLTQIEEGLGALGLKDVKASLGYDVNTGMNKLTIQTITVVDDKDMVRDEIQKYVGTLTEFDTVKVKLDKKPPAEFEENLENRLKIQVDQSYNNGVLTIIGMDLEAEPVERALEYYLDQDVELDFAKKNYNIRSVGPTLGATFRNQGKWALIISFILMSVVVFVAFREAVPCIAVIQAAICDIIIALGGMSLFHIPLEPATIGALLMLIGYSVDTDIMLTSRTLKERRGEFDEKVDDAIKTGITMTGTTIAALSVIFIISTTLTQIPTWANLAAVLLIGLFGDLPATWFTNVGIIKWYVESGRRSKKATRGMGR